MQQPQRARGGRGRGGVVAVTGGSGSSGAGGGQTGRGRNGGADGRGSGGRIWDGDSRRIVAPVESSRQPSGSGGRSGSTEGRGSGGRIGGAEGRGSGGRVWGGDSARIVAPVESSRQPSGSGGRSGSTEGRGSGGRIGDAEGRGSGGRVWGGDSERIVAPVESIRQPSIPDSVPHRPPPVEVESLSKNLQQRMSIEQAASPVAVPPSSSKSTRPPQRPGFGTIGKKVTVVTNHFPVQLPHREIFHYDVAITPEVQSKAVNMSIIQELIKLHGNSQLNSLHPVYDRSKNLYTAGALPFTSKEFVIDLEEEGRNARKFQVAIKLVGKADLTHLHQFLTGRHLDEPREAIHALDVVLRQTPSLNYVPAGRSFFSPSLGGRGPAGNGIEYWMGFYSSLRPTQMGLTLNIDISATSFFEPILLSEYVYQNSNVRDGNRSLQGADFKKIKTALKGVKVQVTHRGEAVRRYRINGITTLSAKDLKFSRDAEETQISVPQYFAEQYKIRLRDPDLPCVMAGSEKKPIYLPMEVCRILEGQRYSKKLNERQVQSLLKATCRRPHERERSIRDVVDGCNHANDKFIREFGITVSREPCTIEGRVLPPPTLKYSDSGREKQCQPNLGQWNMNNKRMVNGGTLNHWGGLNLSELDMNTVGNFCRQLGSTCQQMGMFFNPKPLIGISSEPAKLGQALAHIHGQTSAKLKACNERLQLLIVVLPEKSGHCYGEVKRICETSLGIVSQCCQPKNVLKCAKPYLENLSLKVNVKVNGRNTVLLDSMMNSLPLVTDVPTIIFGADVTHPAPGDDSSPSIAAVVASMDWPEITNYRCLLSAQTHRKEMITDLYKDPDGGMIRDHLLAFSKKKNVPPKRIIFYRDGVSEGQFNEVLLYEMDAIRKACQSFLPNYLPPVTFVVVQKRHHTRFFPRGRDADRSGNILPGTVVDTKICHPTQFDFYLCSHAGIQGTSRPTHYHVLYDENHFTADNLQMLTNKLCYTYNRCTRSVSVVPPAYYAHLAAARARHYVETCASDKDSSASGVSSRASYPSFTLPPLADNVKDVMFYC